MRAARIGFLLLPLTMFLVGCNVFGAMVYYLSPRQMRDAEFELAEGRVAMVIECARLEEENPVFARALSDKVNDLFTQHKVPTRIIPYRELAALRRANPDYQSWSIQRIGRELGAEQVLYARLDTLRFRETPDHPILSPYAAMRLKVIGTNELKNQARLWPEDRHGREVTCSRPPVEAVDFEVSDAEAAKLGRDAAQIVARLFFRWDKEEMPQRER